ncbi:hypothetical protein [Kosakonia sacchari]|uniref:hypothetical protein n=1 Tax=Kosakonia sacchari TaxID=1158459 RepID=UPI001483ACE5|nr:hypothetical protein [Kosakonia sacchari]
MGYPMEYKKLNSALLLTVFILFITTILVLIKVLFSGAKVFEWGSVSDWVSSSSTFGTLVIAWFAYKKAPQWISQRRHDSAFDIAKKLILDDIVELKHIVNSAAMQADDLIWQFEILSSDPEYFLTVDNCEKALEIFHSPIVTPALLKKDINKLKKLGWYIANDANQDLEHMEKEYILLYKKHTQLWVELKKHISGQRTRAKEKIDVASIERIHYINNKNTKFNSHYCHFDELYDHFDEYFKTQAIDKKLIKRL